MATAPGAEPLRIGAGGDPSFSPDGRLLLFKRAGDLWSIDMRTPSSKPKLFAKGGAGWSQFVWTNSGDLIFVDNRRGYSFLGRCALDRRGWIGWLPARIAWRLPCSRRAAMPSPSCALRAQTQQRIRSNRGRALFDRHHRSDERRHSHDLEHARALRSRSAWTIRRVRSAGCPTAG
jgi:hypothetical protein